MGPGDGERTGLQGEEDKCSKAADEVAGVVD